MFNKMRNKVILAGGVATTVLAGASQAMAVGVADAAVTGAMTSLADNIVATLTPVAVAGIGIFTIFLAFRYGKKIFTTAAK